MLFWMTSKVFRDVFLNNENDQDILDAQYVLASTRIFSKGRYDSVINGKNILYPDAEVCMGITDSDIRERYFKQLISVRPFLSTLIKGSIEEKYNIIFLYSKSEDKNLHYLEYLAEFLYIDFGYPCYEYGKYASGASPLLSYNKEKVLRLCDKYLEDAQKKQRKRNLQTKDGRKIIMKEYKDYPKKELKRILKERNLYTPGMDKKDMLDMIETFL